MPLVEQDTGTDQLRGPPPLITRGVGRRWWRWRGALAAAVVAGAGLAVLVAMGPPLHHQRASAKGPVAAHSSDPRAASVERAFEAAERHAYPDWSPTVSNVDVLSFGSVQVAPRTATVSAVERLWSDEPPLFTRKPPHPRVISVLDVTATLRRGHDGRWHETGSQFQWAQGWGP